MIYVISPYTTSDGTKWGIYNGMEYEEREPEEIPALISSIMEIKKDHVFYIPSLSMYLIDIIRMLWSAGYRPIEGNPPIKKMREKQYKYLITGEFKVYQITACRKQRKQMLIDADNIIRGMSQNDVITAWGSGETDCEKYCKGIFKGISMVNDECGAKKALPTTISSAARKKWVNQFSFFSKDYIIPDANNTKVDGLDGTIEEYCRPAYHGGLCYRNTELKNEGEGIVLDVNSLYPYIMATYPLPYGIPEYIEGRPDAETLKECKEGLLYIIVKVRAWFKLKPGKIPCVSLGRSKEGIVHERGWLTTSDYYNRRKEEFYYNKKGLILTLTYTDLLQFKENYNIEKIEYISFLRFKASKNLFKNYILSLYEKKRVATTRAEKTISKMFLNSLSGILAKLPIYENIGIRVDEETGEVEAWEFKSMGGTSWVYMGAAVTAYARRYLMHYIYKVKDRWLYSDTDSIHLKGKEVPEDFTISDQMGDWKIEHEFDNAIYYKRKMYALESENGVKLTLAGVPRPSISYLEGLYKQAQNGVEFAATAQDKLKSAGLDFSPIMMSERAIEAIEDAFEDNGIYNECERQHLLEEEESLKTPYGRLLHLYDDLKDEKGLIKLFYDQFPVFFTVRNEPFTQGTRTEWRCMDDMLQWVF